MRSSDRRLVLVLAGLLSAGAAQAFDMERDTWLLPESAPAGPRADPLEFPRIVATGNEREPVYAEGKQIELIDAAARNDMSRVEALLKEGVNPNARRDRWGENALMQAVAHGNIDMTRALLDAGADPNARARGFTPLGTAALRGHTKIVRLLLRAGADVDRKSNDGNTPIIAAVIMHRTDVVRVLLPHKPDLTIWNREGRVSLGIAVEEGYKDIVQLMLDDGADPNVMDRNGNRPMFWAGEHREIAFMLAARGGTTF